MKSIAFVFTNAPHGTSAGREGLDAVLATAALTDDIALFFISDGVLQLTTGQMPKRILARNYIATFGVLPLYDVEHCYICAASLRERGISVDIPRVLTAAEVLESDLLRQRLNNFDRMVTF